MARGATLHKDRGHRHKLSVGVEFVTVMRDRVFKTGLGVGRISASYLFSALRNVHRPFFTDILSSPLPIARLSPLSLSFFSSLFQLRLVFFGHERWVTGGIIHIRSFLSNFFLFLPPPFPSLRHPHVPSTRSWTRSKDIGNGNFRDPLRERFIHQEESQTAFSMAFPIVPRGNLGRDRKNDLIRSAPREFLPSFISFFLLLFSFFLAFLV